MSVPTITPSELANKVKAGQSVELIDVRTPMEFQEVHATFARNVPLDQMNPQAIFDTRLGQPNEPLYVICRSGGRGRQACEKFQAAGFENVINVDGGTIAWESAGLDVARGRKVMSLERQVRIAAGFLALLGSGLALGTGIVHFAWLSAFIGAGLMFAGITDTCGMAMMLAKMPWNQVSKPDASCST